MLVECSHCGAPLDVSAGKRFVKCAYCSRKNEMAQTRTIQQVTPPKWQPPQVWTPPPQMHAQQAQLKYHKRQSPLLGTVLSVILFGGIGAAVFLVSTGRFDTVAWDEKSTLECRPNGTLRINDVDVKIADDPVIRLGPNCKLYVTGSKLRGRVGIEGSVNNTIEIVDSTIEGEDIGIQVDVNAKVRIKKKSKVKGGDMAIELGNNGDLVVRDSEVRSDGTGVGSDLGGRIDCEDSKLIGSPALGGGNTFNPTKLKKDDCKIEDR
jgi:LSD1 subclass zinc finger protein